MNKTDAAKILAEYVTSRAIRLGHTGITRDFIEMQCVRAAREQGQIAEATRVAPHWTTVRFQGQALSIWHYPNPWIPLAG